MIAFNYCCDWCKENVVRTEINDVEYNKNCICTKHEIDTYHIRATGMINGEQPPLISVCSECGTLFWNFDIKKNKMIDGLVEKENMTPIENSEHFLYVYNNIKCSNNWEGDIDVDLEEEKKLTEKIINRYFKTDKQKNI